MKRSHRVTAVAVLVALTPPPAATAQDSTQTKSPRSRHGLEFGVGLTTRVQAISDAGLGPVVSIATRYPAQSGLDGFIGGVSYAFVPLTRRLPDGSANNSALEGIYLMLGLEWTRGTSTRMDLQWNPAIANVRRWGTQPSWRSKTPQQQTLSAASLGIRWGKPDARIGYSLRLHASLNPLSFFGGAYPTFQVMVRP